MICPHEVGARPKAGSQTRKWLSVDWMKFEGRSMHQPIQEGLEDYLSGDTASPRYREFEAHLSVCPACRNEVAPLRDHALLIRTLRAPREEEPAPGFYARVMDRIETQVRPSFWADFLEPAFARRLMYSSAVLLLLLGGFLFSAGAPAVDTATSAPEAIFAADEKGPDFGANPEHDRETVLVSLASYSE